MTVGLQADEVRAQVKIEEVIGATLALKKAGGTLKGLCPFHEDTTPSLSVNVERQRYHCFSCSADGDVFDFVQHTQGVDFPTAIRLMAERAGIPIPDDPETLAEQNQWARVQALCAAAALYYQGMLASNVGTTARHYSERRGFTLETSARFGLGYAPPDGEEVIERLHVAGYSESEMTLAGLVTRPQGGGAGRALFRDRLMFPLRDRRGQICGFAGRVLGAGTPKYLNSPATPLYTKGSLLYGLDVAQEAIRRTQTAIVVEGYMDVLRAHQAGLAHVVALSGTAITPEQVKLLRHTKRVVLALDGDKAGQSATLRAGLAAQALCSKENWGAVLHVAALPPGTDPDAMIAQDAEGFAALVDHAPTLMDHYFTSITSGLDHSAARWQQGALDALLPAIKTLRGVGTQQHYLERLGAVVGVDAATLRAEMDGQKTAGPRPPLPPQAKDKGTPPLTGPKAIPKAPDWMPTITADPQSQHRARVALAQQGRRTSEEYALGLLLDHAPLEGTLRALVQAFETSDSSLAPYFAHLARGGVSPDDPATQQLVTQAQLRPPVPEEHLERVVRSCLDRATTERLRLLALEGHEDAIAGLSRPYEKKEEKNDHGHHQAEEADTA